MSKNTKIEWTDHTQNFWEGCQKAGPGCDNCYAEARNARFGGGIAGNWGPGAPRRRTSVGNWAKPIAWDKEHADFFAEHGRRQRVFAQSLSDWADNAVPDEWRMDMAKVILATPNLDWLMLTKRIGNAAANLATMFPSGIPSNVWLGATICNQTEADRDIPKLLAVPAAKQFLSMEPLLGPVDIVPFVGGRSIQCGCGFRRDEVGLIGATQAKEGCIYCNKKTVTWPTLDWVIVGGESGQNARPMHPDWARGLRDQCQAAGVPFLFKQWGEWAPRAGTLTGGGVDFQALDPACERWPQVIRLGEHGKNTQICENCTPDMGEEVFVQRVGKKTAGRLLDGREWIEVPA